MEKILQVTHRIIPSDPIRGQIGSIDLIVWLAQLVGMPLTGIKAETRSHKMCVRIYSALGLTMLFSYICLEFYDVFLNWNDVDILSQNLSMTLTHGSYVFKVCNTYYYYSNIKGVVRRLRHLTRIGVGTKSQVSAFYQSETENKLVPFLFINSVFVISALAMIMLLISPHELAGKRLPYRVYMPLFLPSYIQYLYMGFSAGLMAVGAICIDFVNITIMNHVRMHLKMINLAFEELVPSPENKHKMDHKKWLASIIIYHNELIVLKSQVEEIFCMPLLVQFMVSLLIIAMTGFQAIVGDGSHSTILNYFLLGCVVFQLFFYCWFGNEVCEQSKTLASSAYSCSWYEFDAKFKKMLLILMINAERPFVFTAGGLMDLSLQNFTDLLSKSYSVIAVLRQMYGTE